MAKDTLEMARLKLTLEVSMAQWQVQNGEYADNLAYLFSVVAMCASVAKKALKAESKEACWLIGQFVAMYIRDPDSDIRDYHQRCPNTGQAMYKDVQPDKHASDQAQFNAFALRLFELFGVKECICDAIIAMQDDPQMRCYSPIAYRRKQRWPWVAANFFGRPVA